MTDQAGRQVSLEEVRTRFLDSEARLSEAAAAVSSIQEAADRIGSAREGLVATSAQLGGLAGSLGDVASSLAENAIHLREGVDAIRAGDPAEIKRQIEELDAAFTAMQSVTGDRLAKLEQLSTALTSAVDEHAAISRRETRIVAVVLAALILVSAAVLWLT
jgi:hypothetical protein